MAVFGNTAEIIYITRALPTTSRLETNRAKRSKISPKAIDKAVRLRVVRGTPVMGYRRRRPHVNLPAWISFRTLAHRHPQGGGREPPPAGLDQHSIHSEAFQGRSSTGRLHDLAVNLADGARCSMEKVAVTALRTRRSSPPSAWRWAATAPSRWIGRTPWRSRFDPGRESLPPTVIREGRRHLQWRRPRRTRS